MFHDGGYMVGMHAWWWLFWVILIGVLFASPFLKLRGGSAGGSAPAARDQALSCSGASAQARSPRSSTKNARPC